MNSKKSVSSMMTLAALAAATFGMSFASASPETPMPEIRRYSHAVPNMDSQWVMDAASGSLMEIQLAQIAQTKATEPAIRDYATKMVTDHTQALNDLKDLAQKKRVQLPTVVNADQMVIVDYFRNSSSPDWGRDYIKFEIADHTKDITATQKEIAEGTDADTKAQATKMLPILQDHLKMAQDIDATPAPK